MTMLGGGGNPSAWWDVGGVRTAHDGSGEAAGIDTIGQGNDYVGVSVTTTVSPPADAWWAPVETISNSEGGFERVYQGSGLLLSWLLDLAPGESASFEVVPRRRDHRGSRRTDRLNARSRTLGPCYRERGDDPPGRAPGRQSRGSPRTARRGARFGRPDLDADLLAARLPDRFRTVAAGRAAPPRPRAGRRPPGEPEHDPRRLPATLGRRLRHEPPRRRHPCRRPPAAAPRRRGAGRRRLGDAPASGPCRLHRRRGRGRHVRGRLGTQAPRTARPRPVRRVHQRRRRLRCRAADRRIPGPHRSRRRAAGRPARATRSVPLRPRGHDDVPRRGGPGTRRRPRPGRGDGRRPGLRRARPRDRRPAARVAGRPHLRVGARHGQYPRDAQPRRHPRRGHRHGHPRRRGRPGRPGPDGRPHPHVARSDGRRSRGSPVATGADPGLGLRVRPVGPGTAAAGHRARRGGHVRSMGPAGPWRSPRPDAALPRPAPGPRSLRRRRHAAGRARRPARRRPRRHPTPVGPHERRPRTGCVPRSRPARSRPSGSSTRPATC